MSAAESYRQARATCGADPIEAGLTGNLADHECPHGRLPADPTKRCGCWREEGAVLAVARTEKQRADALKVAMAHKERQKQIRKDLGAGRMTVAVALADPAMANKLVIDVLALQNRWGLARAEAFLRMTKVCSPWARAGVLTARQRAVIARELRVKGIAA